MLTSPRLPRTATLPPPPPRPRPRPPRPVAGGRCGAATRSRCPASRRRTGGGAPCPARGPPPPLPGRQGRAGLPRPGPAATAGRCPSPSRRRARRGGAGRGSGPARYTETWSGRGRVDRPDWETPPEARRRGRDVGRRNSRLWTDDRETYDRSPMNSSRPWRDDDTRPISPDRRCALRSCVFCSSCAQDWTDTGAFCGLVKTEHRTSTPLPLRFLRLTPSFPPEEGERRWKVEVRPAPLRRRAED